MSPQPTSPYPSAVFDRATPIADAVLWEGYVLYPYRASAAKNRIRFQWGIVGPAEQPSMTSTVVVERDAVDHVDVRVRFLHLHRRDDGWDQAVERAVDLRVVLADATARRHPITVPADLAGQRPIRAAVRTDVEPAGAYRLLRVDIDNPGQPSDGASRDDLLLTSMIGTHVLFAAPTDAFVSLLDPPDDAAELVERCVNERCWPVLAGPEPRRDLVLASPVILYDFPAVAPQSPGDFFDGTEIDEMLTLRVQTLTDEEKLEARATDPRAAAIIDRCDAMPNDVQAALHGTVSASGDRDDPVDPMPEWSDRGPRRALVGSTWVQPGDKVRLRPSRRADAHDLFLAGRLATIAEIVHTVDDETHVAVTVDDDPAAELLDWHGRYLYFDPDELEIVPASEDADAGSGS